jgi:hypothetical protein
MPLSRERSDLGPVCAYCRLIEENGQIFRKRPFKAVLRMSLLLTMME